MEDHSLYLLIIALGILTFITRIGGHIIISSFGTIHPRLEAALKAVPAAVIATLVFPPALTHGVTGFITMALVAFACLRFSPVIALMIGLGFLIGARYFMGA